MTRSRPARRTRGGERGLTLIELLVTIAIMGVGFGSLLSAFAVLERQATSTSDDTQLTTLARRVGDMIKADTFAYVQCTGPAGQAPSGKTSYQATVVAALGGTTTDTITVPAVAQAQAAGSSDTNGALIPISTCATAGTSSGADYGVQQITFKVVSTTGNSLTRVVYKRWN